jgi:hypothetical protein
MGKNRSAASAAVKAQRIARSHLVDAGGNGSGGAVEVAVEVLMFKDCPPPQEQHMSAAVKSSSS